MVVTWSDLAKHCPWSKGQPIGNGIYCAPWHSASSYPIPPEGGWDLVFVVVRLCLLDFVRLHSSFEAISMKLGGHIGHGPNSSYHHF